MNRAKNEVVAFTRLPKEIKEAADAIAEQKGWTVSHVLREATIAYVHRVANGEPVFSLADASRPRNTPTPVGT